MDKVMLILVGSWLLIGGDSHIEIYKILNSPGDYREDYNSIALQELRHVCCSDFTSPSSCKPGYEAAAWEVEGYKIDNDSEFEKIENIDGYSDMNCLKFEGKTYVVPNDFFEIKNGVSITSDEVRKWHTWNDYKKYIGMDIIDKFEPNCNGGDYPEVILRFEDGIEEHQKICRCGNGCSNTFPINKLTRIYSPDYGDYLDILEEEEEADRES